MKVTCNVCWRPVRLLPVASGARVKFEVDTVPCTLITARVGYVLARCFTGDNRMAFAACPVLEAPTVPFGYHQVLLRHFCARTVVPPPGATVERVAA